MKTLQLIAAIATLSFAVACESNNDNFDDDGGTSSAGSSSGPSACDSACDKMYDCGLCVDAGEGCATRSECKQGCVDSGLQSVAVCVNGVSGCDDGAIHACFSAEPPPSSTGSGGGSCNTCSAYMDDVDVTYESLCASSQSLLDSVAECVCVGACGGACSANACEGFDASEECVACIPDGCAGQLNACGAD
jgi:hypothetical protein